MFPAAATSLSLPLPHFATRVRAGFPSPADDYEDKKLDLNEHLIEHPAATFFVTVEGDSMTGAGIFSGDLLIVDRMGKVKGGCVILAILEGEFTVKRYVVEGKRAFLEPANAQYDRIEVTGREDFEIWGVVSYVIHKPE